MANGDPVDVAVVGAGLSGLYTAWRLQARGWRVVVFESGSRMGGKIQDVKTDQTGDATIHLSPLVTLPRSHHLARLLYDVLGASLTPTGGTCRPNLRLDGLSPTRWLARKLKVSRQPAEIGRAHV
mgnify:FL=1